MVRVVCKDNAVCASPLVWETSWTLCCLVLHVFYCFGAVLHPRRYFAFRSGQVGRVLSVLLCVAEC